MQPTKENSGETWWIVLNGEPHAVELQYIEPRGMCFWFPGHGVPVFYETELKPEKYVWHGKAEPPKENSDAAPHP